jgi:predicted AlkP superfamily pyrophosphatase or phosphodiesterase
MAHPTAVLLVVGLTQELLGRAPRLQAFAQRNRLRRLRPVLPAVTCSVQASMLTGLLPREHGIVGNGWYHREMAEVQFWKQSNRLVEGEKVWETARRRGGSTCIRRWTTR